MAIVKQSDYAIYHDDPFSMTLMWVETEYSSDGYWEFAFHKEGVKQGGARLNKQEAGELADFIYGE